MSNLTGEFRNGEVITGEKSGATHKIVILNTITSNTLIPDNTFNVVDNYDENDIIQSEGDDILDFTEKNPFGRV